MKGHACRRENDGIDRACTAISALTCNLINSLNDLTDDKIESEADSGLTMIKWQELSDKGKLLVDSWFLGLSDINQKIQLHTIYLSIRKGVFIMSKT